MGWYKTPEGKEFLERNPPVQTWPEKLLAPDETYVSSPELHSLPLKPGEYEIPDKLKEKGHSVAYPEHGLRGRDFIPDPDLDQNMVFGDHAITGGVEGGILARFPNDGNFRIYLEKDEFIFHPRVQQALSDITAIEELIKKYSDIAYSDGSRWSRYEREEAEKITTDLQNQYKNLINIYKRQFDWDTSA